METVWDTATPQQDFASSSTTYVCPGPAASWSWFRDLKREKIDSIQVLDEQKEIFIHKDEKRLTGDDKLSRLNSFRFDEIY